MQARASRPPLPAEETALAGLVKARRNLRKLLSDKSSAGLCRKIDMNQSKVRRLPPSSRTSGSSNSRATSRRWPARSGRSPRPAGRVRRRVKARPAGRARPIGKRRRSSRRGRSGRRSTRTRRSRSWPATGWTRRPATCDKGPRCPARPEGRRGEEDRDRGRSARSARRARRGPAPGRSRPGSPATCRSLPARSRPGDAAAPTGTEPGQPLPVAAVLKAGTLRRLAPRFRRPSCRREPRIEPGDRRGGGRQPALIADDLRQSADARPGRTDGRATPGAGRRPPRRAGRRPRRRPTRLRPAQARPARRRREAGGEDAEGPPLGPGRSGEGPGREGRLRPARHDGGAQAQGRRGRGRPGDDEARREPPTGEAVGGEPSARPAPVIVPPVGYTEGVQSILAALQSEIQEIVLREALGDRDEAVLTWYIASGDYYWVLPEGPAMIAPVAATDFS